jgi:predicted DNA-binding protein
MTKKTICTPKRDHMFQVRISDAERDRIRALARRLGMSASALVRHVIEHWGSESTTESSK